MRADMYKVIVERPRREKHSGATAARLRNGLEGPMRLGARAGYGYRSLNENLAPLRRFLRAQLGRPWNKVFSEICANIDRRNTVQQHIHQHIRDFIAVEVGVREGQLIDLARPRSSSWAGAGILQELYVDPGTGLIRLNKGYRSWSRAVAEGRRGEQAKIAARRRKLDEHTLLLLLDDNWFRVEVDVLPEGRRVEETLDGKPYRRVVVEARYDAVLRRHVSREMRAECQNCQQLYGSGHLYAVSKRQISTREIKAHGLR